MKSIFIAFLTFNIVFSQDIIFDYKSSFLNNGNIMILIDPKSGSIIKANHKASKFYGYNIKKLEKMNIKKINTFTKQQVQDEMKDAKDEQRNYFIFNHRVSDNLIHKVRVFSTPIQYNEKTILFSTIIPVKTEQTFIKTFISDLEKQVELQIKEIKQKERKNLLIVVSTLAIVLLLLFYLLYIYYQRKLLSEELITTNNNLEAQKDEFQLLFNLSPVPMAYSDNHGKIINKNLKFTELFKYTTNDIPDIENWFLKAYPNEKYRNQILEIWDQAISSTSKDGIIGPIEADITAKDKKVYNTDIISIELKNGILAVFIDQTEQKSIHKEIEEQKKDILEMINKFKFASDNALAGYWEVDLETNLIDFSNGLFKFLGYKKSDFDNMDRVNIMEKVVHKNDFPRVKKEVKKYLTGEIEKFNIEFQIQHKNGQYTWVNSVGTKQNNKFFGFHIDIEELKSAHIIITEQSKMASMGEMIGNIAHQWRQPLSIISTGATGMLMNKEFGDLSDTQFKETCNIINDNAQFLSKTIDDFRNFIKNERQLSTFNLKENIESFIHLVEPSIKKHNIKLVLDVDETIEINGYSNELIQCYMNIFNNTKDALVDSSHLDKYFFIETYKKENHILIKFTDNADGIQKNVLQRIFEPYFTTKHQSQGTGLGLSMTYNLITDGMNGTISAQNINFNHEGHSHTGAEFIITLPLEIE